MFDGHVFDKDLSEKIMKIIEGRETREVTAVLTAILTTIINEEFGGKNKALIANFFVKSITK